MYYVYKCPVCDNKQDIQHSITETPKVICGTYKPGSVALCNTVMKRVIFPAATIFKGQGWVDKE